MVRAAETGQAERLAIGQVGELQRAVPDRAGTEQRGRLGVRKLVGDAIGILFADDHELGVTAVRVAAGGAEVGAKVFVGIAGGRKDPTNAESIAFLPLASVRPEPGDAADDLVPGDDRQVGRRRAALDLVQLGVTDAASGDAQLHLARSRLRHRQVRGLQRRVGLFERDNPVDQHRVHDAD